MNNTVFAECINGVTEQMQNDQNVDIISDTGVFVIMPATHAKNYKSLGFDVAPQEAINAYSDQIVNNK